MSEELRRLPLLALARQVVLRRRRVLAIALAVPLAATLGLALFLPRSYRGTAVVVVERGAGVSDDDVDARLSVLTNANLRRPRLQALIDHFKLYRAPIAGGSREPLIDQLLKELKIELDKEDRGGRSVATAVRVTFTARSPQLAADVANEVAAFYEREDRRMRSDRAEYTRTKLQAQLADARKRLDEQATRLKDYKMRNLHELPEQVGLHLSALAQLNSRMHRERRPASAPADVPRASSPAREFDPRLDRLAELRSRYTDEHPEVRQLKREIELSPHQPRRSGDELAPPAVAPPQSSSPDSDVRGTLADLTQKAAVHEQGILNAPFRQQELDALLPDYIAARNQYQTLWEKHEQALQWDPDHDGGRLTLLDPAVPRGQAVAPNLMRIAAFGVVAALLIALAVLVLVERMDTSFHSVEDLRAFTRVPILAAVPRLPSPNEQQRKSREGRRFAATLMMLLAFTFAGSVYVSRGAQVLAAWIHPSAP